MFHTAHLTLSDFYAGFHCNFFLSMQSKQVEVVDRTRSNVFSDKTHDSRQTKENMSMPPWRFNWVD